MNDNIEARIQRLEDIESLRQLKFNYTWFLDHKMWDDFKSCFSADFAFEGVGTALSLDEFVPVVSSSLDPLVTSHDLHQHRFEFTSETTANGVWKLRDHLIHPGNRSEFHGRAYYEETYAKENGEWKIRTSVLTYITNEGHVSVPGPATKLALGLTMPVA